MSEAKRYAEQCLVARKEVSKRLERATAESKQIGIYCATRALALLPVEAKARFFDDDPDLWGRFYPPFPIQIESQADLLENPVDELWIMSRTFGTGIIERLTKETALAQTQIMSVDEVLGKKSHTRGDSH